MPCCTLATTYHTHALLRQPQTSTRSGTPNVALQWAQRASAPPLHSRPALLVVLALATAIAYLLTFPHPSHPPRTALRSPAKTAIATPVWNAGPPVVGPCASLGRLRWLDSFLSRCCFGWAGLGWAADCLLLAAALCSGGQSIRPGPVRHFFLSLCLSDTLGPHFSPRERDNKALVYRENTVRHSRCTHT